MKFFTFLFFLLLFSFSSFAQGDACSDPIWITPQTDSCTSPGYTNEGYDGTGDPAPSCWASAPDNSVWFAFVADSAQVTINTNFSTSPGDITDTEVALFEGSCGSLTEIDCNEDIGPDNTMAALSYYGLTSGNTYYILVDGNNGETGGFNMCVENLDPPPPTEAGQDCNIGLPICDKSALTFDPINVGPGSVDESGSCLTFGEKASTWLIFTAETSGSLEFAAQPLCGCELDWVLYDISSGCGSLLNQVDCNYNFDGENGSATGMGTVPTGANDKEFNASINLDAGKTYGLLIDNYSESTTGFDITWGGTVEFAGPKPAFTSSPDYGCAELTVQFTNTTTDSITSLTWDFGDGSPASSSDNPTHTYVSGGTYYPTMFITGPGGCVASAVDTITVLNNPVADFTYTLSCITDPVIFTNTTTGGSTYEWDYTSDGTIDATTTDGSYTFPGPGTYYTTLIATGSNGCTDTVFQKIELNGLVVSAGNDTTICAGDAINLNGSYTGGDTLLIGTRDTTLTSSPNLSANGSSVSDVINFGTLGGTIKNLCLNITHPCDQEVEIYLTCPGGTQISLSVANGGTGSDYTNTCFQDGATLITSGSPPYTGTFEPEQLLSNLDACSSSGDWTLTVTDNNDRAMGGGASCGSATLVDWSITFAIPDTQTASITYVWTPSDSLSNDTILDPVFSSSVTGTYEYILSVTDLVCTLSDTVAINVINCCADTTAPYIVGSGAIDTSEYINDSTFRILMSEPVFCSTIQADGSDFLLDCSGSTTDCSTYSITGASGDGCTNDTTSWITVTLDKALPINYNNDWKVIPASNSTITDTCGNILPGNGGSAVILPVELIFWKGIYEAGAVVLSWATASEKDVDFFEIQRSEDGVNFAPIGRVKAKGNSQAVQNYQYEDKVTRSKILYYRLKIVETSTDQYYTSIISISAKTSKFKISAIQPVPAKEKVHIVYMSPEITPVDYVVYNSMGVKIEEGTHEGKEGKNRLQLDLSDYPAGIYFFSLQSETGMEKGRFVKY